MLLDDEKQKIKKKEMKGKEEREGIESRRKDLHHHLLNSPGETPTREQLHHGGRVNWQKWITQLDWP